MPVLIGWDAASLARRDYRFIVVGSGPAGLCLAQSLAPAGSVLVLEAGGRSDGGWDGRGYYDLTVSGRLYSSLGTRLSTVGGTSNHWGGNSHPLSPALFGPEAGPHGWPISYSELSRYLPVAEKFLSLLPFDLPPGSTSLERGVLADYRHLAVTRFNFSHPVKRFGEPGAFRSFEIASNIDVLTETRVVDLVLAGDRVATLTLLHRPSRQTATLKASTVVLACGAIENSRTLLWASRSLPAGNPLAGGPQQLTGAYFSDKPFFAPVDMFIDAAADLSDAVPHEGYPHALAWEVSEEFRHQHDLPRFGIFPGRGTPVQSNPDLARIGPYFARQSASYVHVVPSFQFESTPHRDSYVRLDTSSRDDDDIPLAELHWDILAEDIARIRRSVLLGCGLLSQRGYIRSRMRDEYLVEDWSQGDLGYCNHHIGTTRMSASPGTGVVDTNCKVFGVANLYVAGSSVFPSSGYYHPTLNLVALAVRLADHLIASAAP